MHFKNKGKKISFFIVCNVCVIVFVMTFLSNNLMPVIYDYGKYKCETLMTSIINYAVNSQIDDTLKNNLIIENNGTIDISVDVLNSVMSNSIVKSHRLINELETGKIDESLLDELGNKQSIEKIKRGIIYEIPVGRAFDNLLLSNLGVSVPVKYKLIGEINGVIVSNVKEYGINNALIEIGLQMSYKSKIAIPMISNEVNGVIKIPLIIKLVQGEVPDYLLGTNLIGEG